jgi:hypothetical protein
MPASEMYGLEVESDALVSMLEVSISRPQNGEAAHTAAWRLSKPQTTSEVDQERGCSRR